MTAGFWEAFKRATLNRLEVVWRVRLSPPGQTHFFVRVFGA
jgi:hypothetical protein